MTVKKNDAEDLRRALRINELFDVTEQVVKRSLPAFRESIRELFAELIDEHTDNCPHAREAPELVAAAIDEKVSSLWGRVKVLMVGVAIGVAVVSGGGVLAIAKLFKLP